MSFVYGTCYKVAVHDSYRVFGTFLTVLMVDWGCRVSLGFEVTREKKV